jgi:hypothetical protein
LTNKDLINSPSTITQRIFISPSTLYDFVTRAEADYEKVKEKRGKSRQASFSSLITQDDDK